MNWVFFAALIVACNAAKLDRAYLPPESASTAGGSPGSLQTPIVRSEQQVLPFGSFANEHDGIVIDVAAAGTRASQSGLGAPRISYGSMASKVGEAAFRGSVQAQVANPVLGYNPDLSAFHQPNKPSRSEILITRDRGSNIIKYHNDISGNRYSYGYETDNGIKAEENGVAVNGVQAEGGFSYVGDDGQVYSVVYTADEGGYRPVGSHLPTPPPVPVEILRSLEKNSKDEAAGIFEDGSYDAQKYNTDAYSKSETNGKYKDRQINKFNVQFGLGANTNGGFANDNQPSFIRPNPISLFGTKQESSKFSSDVNGFGSNLNQENKFGQINLNSELDSRNEYSQKQNSEDSLSSNFESSSINKNDTSSESAKPLSQQELQETISLGQGQSGVPRPSSYDTSISSLISVKIPSEYENQNSKESSANFSTQGNQNSPDNKQSFLSPIQKLPTYNINKNTGSKNIQNTQELNKENLFESPLSTYTVNKQVSQSTRNPQTSLQGSISSSFGLDKTRLSTEKISGGNVVTGSRPVFSSKQPDRTLTTPFESVLITNNQFSSNLDMEFTSQVDRKPSSQKEFLEYKPTPSQSISTSSNQNDARVTNTPFNFSSQNFNKQGQEYEANKSKFQTIPSITSVRPNNINLSQSTQRPSFTQFNRQSQSPINSYIYNKPSKPFNTAFTSTASNTQPSTISNQLNTETTAIDYETERNKEITSTTFSDITNRFNTNKYSNAGGSSNFFGNKLSSPSNGITQASISSFPSIFPTTTNLESSGQFSSKPLMQQTTPSHFNYRQSVQPSKLTTNTVFQLSSTNRNKMGEMSSQTQQYDSSIYEYNKPSQTFLSTSDNDKMVNQKVNQLNKQFGVITANQLKETDSANRNEQVSFENMNQNKNLDKKTSSIFQQTTLQDEDKLTTSSYQNPTDISYINTQNSDAGTTSQFEVYEYTKPSQTSSSTEQFGQNILKNKFSGQSNKQSTTAFAGSYSQTMNGFQSEAQLTTQFDQAEFERKTEMPEFWQTSTFNEMPTIYQYTKPPQNFISTTQQKNYNNIPFSQNEQTTEVTISTQDGPQYFENFETKTTQDRFDSKQTTSSQFIQGNQEKKTQIFNRFSAPSISQQADKTNLKENMGEIYEYKKPNQTSESTEQMNDNFNKRPNAELSSGFQLQNKFQSNTQLGEIYEYSKPAQVLSTPSHNNNVDQITSQQFGQGVDKVNSLPTFDSNQSGNKLTTQNEGFTSTSSATQSDNSQENVSQIDSTSTTSQGSITRPNNTLNKFAFYSACCKGSQNQKQVSGSSQSIVKSDTASEGEAKHNLNFEGQKLTTPVFKQRERFGGPRKPPSFDETGYHY